MGRKLLREIQKSKGILLNLLNSLETAVVQPNALLMH